MKEKKGVTLIALVITIIIIMILASIAIYSGASTIRYANYNKAKSEIQVIQSYVNQWYKEYQEAEDKNSFLGEYGELIETAIENDKCTQAEIDSTFSGGGITDDNKKSNYRFFSESFLKEEIGLDASFDYLISIKDRNTILFNGIVYNKEIYYTLDDFGLQNIKEISPYSIEFELEQGENTDIVISNVKLGYGDDLKSDISKFIVEYRKNNETNWIDATKNVVKFEDEGETKFKFSVSDYAQYIVKIFTIDKKKEGSNDISLEVRHGIKVGDYITYTSPTASVSLSTTETGYSSTQTLSRKDTFRVMEIKEDGGMVLIGAMTSQDDKIYFTGGLGYNNAVYTLNKKCSDLYKDEARGITARSMKVEDITDKFNDYANSKITDFLDYSFDDLSVGNRITSLNRANRTATYRNVNNIIVTYYPDIIRYEKECAIDNVPTQGLLGQSDIYNGYNYNGETGLTNLGMVSSYPSSLTLPYTYYVIDAERNDYTDTKNAGAFYNMFFETGTTFYLASRCIGLSPAFAYFNLRTINGRSIDVSIMRISQDEDYSSPTSGSVCPIVYIPANVGVNISANPKNQTNANGTPHVVREDFIFAGLSKFMN